MVAGGFVLVALTWGKVAGLDSVALQLPYLLSGGFTGLGLIVVGTTAINVDAKQRQTVQWHQHTDQLLALLHQVAAPAVASAGSSHVDMSAAARAKRPVRLTLLYGGVLMALAGFVLIAATSGQVSALESVPLQLPYLLSGGLTGLGLIIVGATAVNIHAKRREAAERDRQMQQLLEIIHQLASAVDTAQMGEMRNWDQQAASVFGPPLDEGDVDDTRDLEI